MKRKSPPHLSTVPVTYSELSSTVTWPHRTSTRGTAGCPPGTPIVEVETKCQIMFPFSEITTQKNGNKSSFKNENRESWRLVVTATKAP